MFFFSTTKSITISFVAIICGFDVFLFPNTIDVNLILTGLFLSVTRSQRFLLLHIDKYIKNKKILISVWKQNRGKGYFFVSMACTCFLIHFFFFILVIEWARPKTKTNGGFCFFFFWGDYRSQSMCTPKGWNFLHVRVYLCSVSLLKTLCNKQKRLCSHVVSYMTVVDKID